MLFAVQASHYVISTNNANFNHPNDEAVAQVLFNAGNQPTLWFNYGTQRNRRWADAVLQRRFGFSTVYPAGDAASDSLDMLTPPAGELVADFEGGQLPPSWCIEGTFRQGPVAGTLAGQLHVSGHLGRGLMNSFHGGAASTGMRTSPEFMITRPFISFLIGGGSTYFPRLELRVGDQVAHHASGNNSEVRALVEPEALVALRGLPAVDAQATVARQLLAPLCFAADGVCEPLGLKVFKGPAGAVRVGYDPARCSFFIDRTTSASEFAGQSERRDGARVLDALEIMLGVWVDGSTLELFADGGTVVIADLVYADPIATGVAVLNGPESPTLLSMALHRVRASIHAPRP